MKSETCRLCNSKLFPSPLLGLDGMPNAAQYFPVMKEFKEDTGILLKIHQCSFCGLVQLNIDPVNYFREVITAASLSGKSRNSRFNQMKEFVDRFGLSGSKILEIGSAKGEMLDVLEEVGLVAYGIESSKKSINEGKSFGRKMIHGYIGDLDEIDGAPFDCFISFNYLEHLPNPGTIIRKIYNNTSSEAVGFITVPNLTYLLKTKCYYEFVADHLSYFTEDTLSYAFESNGFVVLESNIINEENDIAVVVQKRKALDISSGINKVELLIEDLKAISDSYKKQNKKIAVWGAGHRTLALLALCELEIEYVIDSAIFKQGKFTPVMHAPIVSPSILTEKEVALVIVMVPGLYPGEVLTTLSELDCNSEIAVLKDNKIKFI